METLVRDIRYAVRRVLNSPGFTIVAVLSLALGVGANTAIFTMVNTLLLSPKPFQSPEELVEIYPSEDGRVGLGALSYPELDDIREGTTDVFGGVATTSAALVQVNLEDRSETQMGEIVTWNFFELLGIDPVLGRTFLEEEDLTPDSKPVIVLGFNYWQTKFGGEETAIGQTLRLSGRLYTVVGVVPADVPSIIPGFTTAIYAPRMMVDHIQNTQNSLLEARGSHSLFGKARLLPGATTAQAQAALDRVVTKTHEDFPDYPDGWGLKAIPSVDVAIHPLFDGVLYPAAGVLMGVVGLVLLIACVNLASFLLARATDRRKEIALRLALGSGKAVLLRQLLTESVLLGLAGGIAGFLLASVTLRLMGAIELPLPIPIDLGMTPDTKVLGFTLLASVVAGLFFGLFPALQTINPDLAPTLKNESVLGRPPRRFTMRNVLVVSQVAVSFLLLVGSGLFLRSLQAAAAVDPGFGNEPTSIVWLGLSRDRYDDETALRYFREVMDDARAIPGVEAVGLVNNLALGGMSFNSHSINVPGVDPPPGVDAHYVDVVVTDPGYFDAAGVEIVSGRNFRWTDEREGNPVAIISRKMAEKFWPGEDAVGKTMTHPTDEDGQIKYTVVGIAADTNVRALGEAPLPYLYLPVTQRGGLTFQILARTAIEPLRIGDQVLSLATRIDQDVMVIDSKSMDQHFGFMLFPFRLGGMLLAIFGGLTVLLASIGLYGVVSYAVAARTREVGVRMSLGARGSQVIAMVMKGGLSLVGIGLAIGLGLSLFATPLLRSLLFGIEPFDPAAFLAVGVVLTTVAVAAALLPAIRASRVNPVTALRYE